MTTVHQSRILQVDFSWKKFKGLISDVNNPEAGPLYIVEWNAVRSPHLIFKRPADDRIVGTGTLHTFRINADYEVAGQKGTLIAQKRFKTLYTHQSYAYSNTNEPVTMTWSSESGFTTWDFVCVDERQRPVAKYSAKIWGVKKIGNVEFMDDRPLSDAARDEIVVTGLTLFYCMWLRVNNIFSLFGAVFSRPGSQ
ncbi:hypothetical protein BDW59DRAFT_35365 [Aspergillus cavernicola]|uniref:Tubby C-terminal-like domain-containing protein n=1 Tax=Aspergillus cavernicola TaxID=176166 RepID=A0ABR4HCJ3_9EURO